MQGFSIGNYVVLDRDIALRDIKAGDGTHKWTSDGQVLYPVGNIIPVIRSGDCCLGMAKIEAVTIREETTTVFFRMIKDNGNYQAIYDAYATQSRNDDDDYSGAAFGVAKAQSSFLSHRPRRHHDDRDETDQDAGSGFSADEIRQLMRQDR